jgi:UTP:GlnB (protein PII) uridylyltransferase
MHDAIEVEGKGGFRVRFVGDDDGALTVLELEIPRTEPVVPEIHQALYDIDVHISKIEVSVRGDTVVERLHLAERDGSCLAAERHLQVQNEVMDIVQRRLVASVRPGLASARATTTSSSRAVS